MAIPSVYINLEDDVSKIVIRLKHQSSPQVVLVCPKRCFLFSDSINLKLLKKQADLLGKELFILTMDEKGQGFAQDAGFELKYLPKSSPAKAFSDVRLPVRPEAPAIKPIEADVEPEASVTRNPFVTAAVGIKNIAQKIIPPKISTSEPEPIIPPPTTNIWEPKVEVKETLYPPVDEIRESGAEGTKKSHTGKMVTGIAAVSLIIVLLLALVVLPKATVVVYPKTEAVTRDMQISVSENAKTADPINLVLPGTAVSETVAVSDKFQSQGKTQVGNKATGTVKIYNFTKLPINLKSATTVLSVGGKTYNLVSDVADLKPTLYSNARTKEVDTSSLSSSVDIIAANGGDDSNLPQGTRLEISNQVFGSRPLLLYAVADSEITGGTTRYLSVIDQSDLDSAKTQLQSEALKQVTDKLGSSGQVLPDGAYMENLSQFTTDNPVGSQTPSFTASLQAVITGVAFNRNDLDNLIFQRIGQTLDMDKTLQQISPDQVSYKAQNLDVNSGLVVLQTHYQGQAVYNVDLRNITPQLVGKSQSQVNQILQSKAAIDRVDITLAPSWQKYFPLFAGKIQVSTGTEPDPGN
jgi:hypothetical protein